MIFNKINIYTSKKIFLFLLLFLLLFDVFAKGDYSNELIPGAKIIFHHWDVEQSKITGYSNFLYEKITENGQQYILEQNENTKQDGEVYTRKKIWFLVSSGMPIRYEEEDFRRDFRIINTYSEQKIKTHLYQEPYMKYQKVTKKNLIDMKIFLFCIKKFTLSIIIEK